MNQNLAFLSMEEKIQLDYYPADISNAYLDLLDEIAKLNETIELLESDLESLKFDIKDLTQDRDYYKALSGV